MAELGTASGAFLTTHWSIVAAAAQSAHPDSAQALESLCRSYWQPVYGFIRRSVPNLEEARDLTQAFFEHLLEKRTLTRADPRQGRFRSFLLGSVKFFLADYRDRLGALKRGGHIEFLQFDTVMAETRSSAPALNGVESQFDRDWALAILDRSLQRLREEFTASGRLALFDNFKLFLSGQKPNTSYAEMAAHLNMTEGAAKMTVKRMRDRFAAIIRQEISQTVLTPEDLDLELRAFVQALTSE